jgi:hypothetical protein
MGLASACACCSGPAAVHARFDVQVTRVEPPFRLEARAAGELDGTGRWTLTSADGGTLVRYDWDVRTTRRWMNLLAPAARPVFRWNHDELMREGGREPGPPPRRGPGAVRHASTAAPAGQERAMGRRGGRADDPGRAGMASACLVTMSLVCLCANLYVANEPAGNQRASRAYGPADQGNACRADGKLKVSAAPSGRRIE